MSDHLDYDNLRADTVRQGRQTDGRIRHYRPQVRRTAIPARQTPVHRDRHRRRPRHARPPGRLDARPRQRTPGSDWFRDADVADVIDAALFVGLTDWYPPNYDCGACGYPTCAEFLHATKQLQNDSAELEFAGPQVDPVDRETERFALGAVRCPYAASSRSTGNS
jgi:Putative Fe-S cluster